MDFKEGDGLFTQKKFQKECLRQVIFSEENEVYKNDEEAQQTEHAVINMCYNLLVIKSNFVINMC